MKIGVICFLLLVSVQDVSAEQGKSDGCGCNQVKRNNLVSRNSNSETCSTESMYDCDEHKAKALDEEDGEASVQIEDESATLKMDPVHKDPFIELLKNPMVQIDGGKSFMGTEQVFIAPDGEGPMRPVQISSFYLDKREVSNREFDSFVKATDYKTEVSY